MTAKIYISGKITGLPMSEVEKKFEKAEQYLTGKGFVVVNPCKLDHSANVNNDWLEYMKIDLKALLDCRYIALLPCWMSSPGALIEFDLAIKMRMSVINLEGMI